MSFAWRAGLVAETPWIGDLVMLGRRGDELLLAASSTRFSSSSLIDGRARQCPLFSDSGSASYPSLRLYVKSCWMSLANSCWYSGYRRNTSISPDMCRHFKSQYVRACKWKSFAGIGLKILFFVLFCWPSSDLIDLLSRPSCFWEWNPVHSARHLLCPVVHCALGWVIRHSPRGRPCLRENREDAPAWVIKAMRAIRKGWKLMQSSFVKHSFFMCSLVSVRRAKVDSGGVKKFMELKSQIFTFPFNFRYEQQAFSWH